MLQKSGRLVLWEAMFILELHSAETQGIDNIRNAEPTQMTELGNASLRYDLDGEEGEYGLYIEDEQVMLGNSLDNTAIQIDVYRNDTKIDSVRFASSTLDDITEEIKLTAVR